MKKNLVSKQDDHSDQFEPTLQLRIWRGGIHEPRGRMGQGPAPGSGMGEAAKEGQKSPAKENHLQLNVNFVLIVMPLSRMFACWKLEGVVVKNRGGGAVKDRMMILDLVLYYHWKHGYYLTIHFELFYFLYLLELDFCPRPQGRINGTPSPKFPHRIG